MDRAVERVLFEVNGPYMDQGVPRSKVKYGSFPLVVGADGRYGGGIAKFWGMRLVVEMDGVSGMGAVGTYGGVSWMKPVSFLKTGTATMVRGFVVRWDAVDDEEDEEVCLVWSVDGGSTWTRTEVYATGAGIAHDADMDCDVYENFLMVGVDGEAPKVVYWGTEVMAVADMGAGDFAVELGKMGLVSSSMDEEFFLEGDETYQVAYRLYSSVRNVCSAMSEALTVRLDVLRKSRASGYVAFNEGGGDSGLLIDGDKVTVGARTYEADSNSSVTEGNVAVTITGLTTVAQMCEALADAVNGDEGQGQVTAVAGSRTVRFEARSRGADGNEVGLSKTEAGGNTDDMTVSGAKLTGGGMEQEGYGEPNTKMVVSLPDDEAVVSGKDYDDIAAMFDKVQIFRSIGTGRGVGLGDGAILYMEDEISLPGSVGAWDAATVEVGSLTDDALMFQDQYNPETDFVVEPPSSGAIARYQGLTFMASAPTDDGGLDVLHSSVDHESPEYFTTYNRRRGSGVTGKIRKMMAVGDSLFVLGASGVTHVFKSARERPLQYVDLHRGRGVVRSGAANAVGNSVAMLTGSGLMLLNGADGNMGQITGVDRVVFDRWRMDLGTVGSGYDAKMNASYFLCPGLEEVLVVSHGTQSVQMLRGANFEWVGDGPGMDGQDWRAYFVTKGGRVVVPDCKREGSGTMWDISDVYTLNGAVTTATATQLTDSGATFDGSMVGALLYVTSGTYEGQCREITAVGPGTLGYATFGAALEVGVTYAVSPVPFEVVMSRLRDMEANKGEDVFRRWKLVGVACMFEGVEGMEGNVSAGCVVGAYRNGAETAETGTGATATFTMTNGGGPSDAVGAVAVDGITVQPFVRQISSGTRFTLTNVEAIAKLTDSREAA
jgi:hypothetical protein